MPDWLRTLMVVLALLLLLVLLLLRIDWVRSGRAAGGHPLARWWSPLLALAIVIVLLARLAPGPAGAPGWDAVPRWMTCIDCTLAERSELDSLALRDPGATVEALRDALLKGLGGAGIRDLRHTLRRMHRQDSLYAERIGGSLMTLRPRDEYVRDHLAHFDRAWRVRAALGLGRVAWVLAHDPPSAALAAGVRALLDSAVADTVTPSHAGGLHPTVGHAALRVRSDSVFVRDSIP